MADYDVVVLGSGLAVGPRIDRDGRVMNASNQPVPGLYAGRSAARAARAVPAQ